MPKTSKNNHGSNRATRQRPESAEIGQSGLNSAADYKRFATAIAVDVICGRLGFREAGAAGAQLKSVIKITELEHRYGYARAKSGAGKSQMLIGE